MKIIPPTGPIPFIWKLTFYGLAKNDYPLMRIPVLSVVKQYAISTTHLSEIQISDQIPKSSPEKNLKICWYLVFCKEKCYIVMANKNLNAFGGNFAKEMRSSLHITLLDVTP